MNFWLQFTEAFWLDRTSSSDRLLNDDFSSSSSSSSSCSSSSCSSSSSYSSSSCSIASFLYSYFLFFYSTFLSFIQVLQFLRPPSPPPSPPPPPPPTPPPPAQSPPFFIRTSHPSTLHLFHRFKSICLTISTRPRCRYFTYHRHFLFWGKIGESARPPLNLKSKLWEVVPGCPYNEAYHCNAETLNISFKYVSDRSEPFNFLTRHVNSNMQMRLNWLKNPTCTKINFW